MFNDDDERDKNIACYDDGGSGRCVWQGKDGEQRRSDDRCQRNIACEEHNHQEDSQNIEDGGEGNEREEDAERGGYALASAKAQPDREAVAENGG